MRIEDASTNNLIRENTINTSSYGIAILSSADNNEIRDTSVFSTYRGLLIRGINTTIKDSTISSTGDAIFLRSDRNKIERNTITTTEDGIYAEGASNRIIRNTITTTGTLAEDEFEIQLNGGGNNTIETGTDTINIHLGSSTTTNRVIQGKVREIAMHSSGYLHLLEGVDISELISSFEPLGGRLTREAHDVTISSTGTRPIEIRDRNGLLWYPSLTTPATVYLGERYDVQSSQNINANDYIINVTGCSLQTLRVDTNGESVSC